MRGSAGPFYAEAGGADRQDRRRRSPSSSRSSTRSASPSPPSELDKAKNYVALLLPRNFETTESLAGSLAQVFVYNLPADYYATFTDRVRAITPADAQRAAERYLQPDKFAVVVVGDLKVDRAGHPGAEPRSRSTTVTIDDVMK